MESPDPRNLVPPGRTAQFTAFVAAVLVVAVLVSAGGLVSLPSTVPDLPAAFWTMAVLAVACDARPFLPPGRGQSSSAVFPSTCFTFAILLGWGLGPRSRCRRSPWWSPESGCGTRPGGRPSTPGSTPARWRRLTR
ncbi:hypothetical protein GCM10029963_31870 [Micromonospora andamanensis]